MVIKYNRIKLAREKLFIGENMGYVKNAMVVGGARGIGYAIAKGFVDEGYWVIIADVDQRNGKMAAARLRNAEYHYVDITSRESIKELADYVRGHYKHITHLASTAGKSLHEEVEVLKDPNNHPLWDLAETTSVRSRMNSKESVEADTIERTILLNLVGTIWAVKYLSPLLRFAPQRNRSITLTSSINSWGGYKQPVYSAAKGGIESFVYASADEMGRYGIRINAIVPGSTITPLTLQEGMDPQKVKESSPMYRYNTPHDMRELVMFLAKSSAVTGECYVIDSGQTKMRSIRRYGEKKLRGKKK